MKLKLIKIFSILEKTFLLLVVGLIPIFFQCSSYRCWEINNLLVLVVFLSLAIICRLFLLFFAQSPVDFNFKTWWPALLVIVILTIATIFSNSPWRSFWGDYRRKMGLITWLYLFLFFISAIINFRDKKIQKILLWVILITAVPVCFYGFLQIFGIDFTEWGADTPWLSKRIFSTFGQPNFLASWLLFIIPIAIFCFSQFRLIGQKILVSMLILLLLGCLILTLSRGGWIGFGAEVVFALVLYLFLTKRFTILKTFIIVLFALLIIYLGLNIFIKPPVLSSNFLVARLESLVFLKNSVTGHTRLLAWQVALELISKRPVLGYGPEMMSIFSPQYYQPQGAVYEAINSFPDRAHNDFLDSLLNGGGLFLLAYLAFIVFVFCRGLRTIRNNLSIDKFKTGLVVALLIGLFGYLVSLQFSFHVVQTSVYFWLFCALILILSTDQKTDRLENTNMIRGTIKKRIIIFILLVLIVIWFLWYFGIRMLVADWYYKQAVIGVRNKDLSKMLTYYGKTMMIEPDESAYRQAFAIDLLSMVEGGLDKTTDAQSQLTLLKNAAGAMNDIPVGGREFEARAALTKIYALIANYDRTPDNFSRAEKSFQELAQQSPQLASTYNNWCQFKIYENKLDEALLKCQKALDLYPPLNHQDLNDIHRQQIVGEMVFVYERIGHIYFTQKKYSQALETYWMVLRLRPFQYNLYKKIADIYYLKGDINSAIEYNLHGLKLSPKDSTWPFAIALLYYEKGDFKSASFYGNQALKISPDRQAIINFLKLLK